MNVNVYTGPDLEPLVIVQHHCPACGVKVRIPAEILIQRTADKIEEYYKKRNDQLIAENNRLREIIETGGMIQMIKELATGKAEV